MTRLLYTNVAGRGSSGGTTETPHLRHHKRPRGYRPHREEEQEQHPMEVGITLFVFVTMPLSLSTTLILCEFRVRRGAGPGCNTQEVGEKLTDLKEEISKLEDHEQLLDTHTRWIQQSIKNIENDIINRKYAYITYEDVKENFADQFVLTVQGPPDTELTVPNVLKVFKGKTIYNCNFYEERVVNP